MDMDAYPGMWQFPGGRVESSELHMPLRAAHRELKEETGLDAALDRFVYIDKTAPMRGYKGELYIGWRYGIVIAEGEELQHAEPEKHTPWIWVPGAELYSLPLLQGTLPYAIAFEMAILTSSRS